jgi:NAD(P)-dependent dehydrogenase (short-subunit alcohol dehydrogenase family)
MGRKRLKNADSEKTLAILHEIMIFWWLTIMEQTLSGKVAFITGCARGIGHAVAERFAQAGAALVLFDLLREPLEALAERETRSGGRVLVVQGDVSREDSVSQAVERAISFFGRIDVLINVAGITGPTALVEDISLREWEETLAVNLTSIFLLCRKIVPHMKQRRTGSIVNISSLLGTRGKALRTPYSASKWAVLGLSRSIALEVGPYNIRVNTICPGTVEGERIDRVRRLRAEAEHTTVEEIAAADIKNTPLRRTLSAGEIASVALFLASEDASAITGEEIVVSAGKQ